MLKIELAEWYQKHLIISRPIPNLYVCIDGLDLSIENLSGQSRSAVFLHNQNISEIGIRPPISC